ncbi:MAG: hypothetical protein AAF636_11540 [Pseudomonadota bacterium]
MLFRRPTRREREKKLINWWARFPYASFSGSLESTLSPWPDGMFYDPHPIKPFTIRVPECVECRALELVLDRSFFTDGASTGIIGGIEAYHPLKTLLAALGHDEEWVYGDRLSFDENNHLMICVLKTMRDHGVTYNARGRSVKANLDLSPTTIRSYHQAISAGFMRRKWKRKFKAS